jgi:hypothetical protein
MPPRSGAGWDEPVIAGGSPSPATADPDQRSVLGGGQRVADSSASVGPDAQLRVKRFSSSAKVPVTPPEPFEVAAHSDIDGRLRAGKSSERTGQGELAQQSISCPIARGSRWFGARWSATPHGHTVARVRQPGHLLLPRNPIRSNCETKFHTSRNPSRTCLTWIRRPT